MGFYEGVILPRLIDLAMGGRMLAPYREEVAGAAEGRVLEIGVGSGLNFPYYTDAATAVVGVDPSKALARMAARRRAGAGVPVELVGGSAETLPFEDASFDTVVTTWTLCTIPDAAAALAEMRRVLRPGGRLLFVEHGRAPEPRVRAWQDRLNPLWRPVAGGCNLNRPIDALVAGAGFRVERLETGYMKGPKPWTFLYRGSARPG